MKIYRAKLHTGGKTPEQIERENEGWDLSEAEINQMIEYYNKFDGAEVVVTKTACDRYRLLRWPENENSRIKEAIYLMEQDSIFGNYVGQREEFNKVWDAGTYISDASITFYEADVEIIELLPTKSEVDAAADEKTAEGR